MSIRLTGKGIGPPLGGFAVWYGFGQTEELPTDTLPDTAAVSVNGIKGWTASTPNRIKHGGINAEVTNIADESDADFDDDVRHSLITLSPGEYSFFGILYGNQLPDNDLHVRIEQAISGVDDIIRIDGTTRQRNFAGSGTNEIHAVFEINRPNFVTNDVMKIYLRLVNFRTTNLLSGFLQIKEEI